MLKNCNFIAFGGFKGVGKDTSAKMLKYLLNTPKIFHSYFLYNIFKNVCIGKWDIISFAGPLKRCLSAMLSIPIKMFENRTFKEKTYIQLDTMNITKTPPTFLILSDNKFNKLLDKEDFRAIRDSYITIRQFMQCWGTNIQRKYCGDKIWTLLTLNSPHKIISDLRFVTEATEVKKKKGILIYISRPNYIAGNHASEKEVELLKSNRKFDYIINNDGSLKDLFNKIKNLI